ncbi:MAG: acyl carrier protein [Bacteroidota bacterium]
MENKIKEIIVSILEDSGNYNESVEIEASSRLREDLGMDSFNLAELTVHIEEEFDVDIFEDGLVNTVGEIFAKLNKHK